MLTSGDLRHDVEEHIINPDISEEIKSLLKSRNRWKKISNVTETFGHFLILSSTILAFASGVYKCNDSLSFAAGCVNAASISFLRFSSYAFNESNERTTSLNTLLARINVAPLPNEINNSDTNTPVNTPSVALRNDVQSDITPQSATSLNSPVMYF